MRNIYIIFLLLIPPVSHGSDHQSEFDKQDRLRTLFTTQQLRYQLDRLRNQGKYAGNMQAETGVLRKPVKIKLQGAVFRDNKIPVIFINNKSTLQSPVINEKIVIDSEATKRKNYQVPVRINRKYISLKPGQQWDESNKEVQDSYLINQNKAVIGPAEVLPDKSAYEANSDKN
ncbi:MAG TPA: hypothetical protein ENJ08_03355 [Gammaproteobacteria bacterium]|nr:hypothetical protein [Gammaproteobacteria bacterium]